MSEEQVNTGTFELSQIVDAVVGEMGIRQAKQDALKVTEKTDRATTWQGRNNTFKIGKMQTSHLANAINLLLGSVDKLVASNVLPNADEATIEKVYPELAPMKRELQRRLGTLEVVEADDQGKMEPYSAEYPTEY